MEWRGQYGGVATPGHEVIADAAAWEAAWAKAGDPAPPAPDFAKRVAVAVFLGSKPTGGYRVSFRTEAEGDDLVVRYRAEAPTGLVTQAFTQPWAVRVFPKPKGRVRTEAAP